MSLCDHIRTVKTCGRPQVALRWPTVTRSLLLCCLAGCAAGPRPPVAGAPDPCDPRGRQVAIVGKSADGKPTVRTLSVAGRVSCRSSDANGDGQPELEQAFDPSGELIRERFDLDGDGRFDRTDYLLAGALERRELDTNGDGKTDVRLLYVRGQLSRVEADEDADGRFDYFEEWSGGQLVRSGIL